MRPPRQNYSPPTGPPPTATAAIGWDATGYVVRFQRFSKVLKTMQEGTKPMPDRVFEPVRVFGIRVWGDLGCWGKTLASDR